MNLRLYQEEALEAIQKAHEVEGLHRLLLSLPTGTGKTVVFAHLVKHRPGRALILAHRDELLSQAAQKLLQVDRGVKLGIVKAEQDHYDAPVVIASVQTLSRPHRLERLRPNFETIIIDEAHHAHNDTYRRILEHLGAFSNNGKTPLTVGVTATPGPGKKVWQKVVYQKTLLEMIHAGYLCDLRAIQVDFKVDLSKVNVSHGDFVAEDLAREMKLAGAPHVVARAYHQYAAERKALVFTPTVAMAHAMAEALVGIGVAAEALDGNTETEKRRGILSRLHGGQTKVVANCAVLTEGFDEPSVDCIVIARPTRSKTLYQQMIGRGTRPYPEKEDCLILDMVGATGRHDLVTLAALYDVEPMAVGRSLVGAVEESLAEKGNNKEPAELFDGVLTAREVDLFAAHQYQVPLHWVKVYSNLYALPVGKVFLCLFQETADEWRVGLLVGKGKGKRLGTGLPFGYAQGMAEDYARQHGGEDLERYNVKGANWRRQAATEKQRQFLLQLGGQAKQGISAGEVSDQITVIKVRDRLGDKRR